MDLQTRVRSIWLRMFARFCVQTLVNFEVIPSNSEADILSGRWQLKLLKESLNFCRLAFYVNFLVNSECLNC